MNLLLAVEKRSGPLAASRFAEHPCAGAARPARASIAPKPNTRLAGIGRRSPEPFDKLRAGSAERLHQVVSSAPTGCPSIEGSSDLGNGRWPTYAQARAYVPRLKAMTFLLRPWRLGTDRDSARARAITLGPGGKRGNRKAAAKLGNCGLAELVLSQGDYRWQATVRSLPNGQAQPRLWRCEAAAETRLERIVEQP